MVDHYSVLVQTWSSGSGHGFNFLCTLCALFQLCLFQSPSLVLEKIHVNDVMKLTCKYTVKRHFYVHEKIMCISQNGPLANFMGFFLFMYVSCMVQ